MCVPTDKTVRPLKYSLNSLKSLFLGSSFMAIEQLFVEMIILAF